MDDLIKYLCCPKCRTDLVKSDKFLFCKNCNKKYEIENGIVKIMPNYTEDVELSIMKWDNLYKKQLKNNSYLNEYKNYEKNYFNDTYKQLNNAKKIQNIVYLEIGCGHFFFGQKIANDCHFIIGIDFCPTALEIAKKMLDEKGINNYLLIQGDILNIPLKDNSIDLIYGGGVIEHFKETQMCVNELYRVLRNEGISFNTVPYLNLGSLTYRQIWGNIPNLPILKQIAEFIHIKLLKAKHMIFGYEMSFTGTTLKSIHKKAGFKNVKVDKFEVKLAFDFIPKSFKKLFIWLATNSRLFWPMVKVIGQK